NRDRRGVGVVFVGQISHGASGRISTELSRGSIGIEEFPGGVALSCLAGPQHNHPVCSNSIVTITDINNIAGLNSWRFSLDKINKKKIVSATVHFVEEDFHLFSLLVLEVSGEVSGGLGGSVFSG